MSDQPTTAQEFLDRVRSLDTDYLVGYLASVLTRIANDDLTGETAQEHARRALAQLEDQAADQARPLQGLVRERFGVVSRLD